jgi:hypothetical protein
VKSGQIKSGSTGVVTLNNGSMKWRIPEQYRNTSDQTFTNLAFLNNWQISSIAAADNGYI